MNENLGTLSREDLEVAVRYWQPKALGLQAENNKIKEHERRLSKMRFWRRLRWALTRK